MDHQPRYVCALEELCLTDDSGKASGFGLYFYICRNVATRREDGNRSSEQVTRAPGHCNGDDNR